jgi:hypothetical protein
MKHCQVYRSEKDFDKKFMFFLFVSFLKKVNALKTIFKTQSGRKFDMPALVHRFLTGGSVERRQDPGCPRRSKNDAIYHISMVSLKVQGSVNTNYNK